MTGDVTLFDFAVSILLVAAWILVLARFARGDRTITPVPRHTINRLRQQEDEHG